MCLSIYDPQKGCFVLKPMKPEIINAFHPDYVKTYHPDLMKDMRIIQRGKDSSKSLSKYVEKARETNPSHGTVFGVTEKSISVAPKKMMKRVDLATKEFHVYNKAGLPKGVKK